VSLFEIWEFKVNIWCIPHLRQDAQRTLASYLTILGLYLNSIMFCQGNAVAEGDVFFAVKTCSKYHETRGWWL